MLKQLFIQLWEMPKMLCLILSMVLVTGCAPEQQSTRESIAGRWEGTVEFQGARLRTIIDFHEDAGGLRGMVTTPDSLTLDAPLESVSYTAPRVSFEILEGGDRLRFDGTRQADRITGVARGGEMQLAIELRRTGDVPPVPHRTEEVSFRNGETQLSGTVYLPRTTGQHPAVVMIHGSGPATRDGFRFFADALARQGIATLIYDKRNIGNIPGTELADASDYARDALAGVALLKSRADINPRKIGLWGGSQGGGVAAVAASESKDVAFLVSMSGGGITYAELIRYQIPHRLRGRGFNEDEIRDAMTVLNSLHDFVRTGENRETVQRVLDQAWTRRWASVINIPRTAPTEAERRTWIQWRHLDTDPQAAWRRVKCPALLIWGERDLIVPVELSVTRIREALTAAGNQDVTVKIFPGADHNFRLPVGVRSDTNGKWDFPRSAPGFVETVLDWIRERVK